MFFNGIDFPNQIVDAIKNDKLVVFAGAGASADKPTSLPDFNNLAKEIAEGTGEVLGKKDSCEVFLGFLKAKGIDVNKIAVDILSGVCLEHNKLHEAIIDLFKSMDDIKIVTTNYDQMFEQVIESRNGRATVFNVPALPLGDDVRGIVHIHGNVDEPKYMVVTDEDFGRAYLTEGYASKFLVRLFESYMVLFIGYSYNDTILRYLTRAMLRKTESRRYILTDDNKSNWSALGIEPVFFPKRSYAVMREGLIKLGNGSKKGLVEWQTQFEEICEMPPKDLTADTEIDYCLENHERSMILAKSIQGKEWLDFLDRKNVFSECFCNTAYESKNCELWARWLCDNFVGKDDESLLLLIYRHKNVISKQFSNFLVRKLIITDEIDTSYFMNYVLLLDHLISDCFIITKLIEELVFKGQY